MSAARRAGADGRLPPGLPIPTSCAPARRAGGGCGMARGILGLLIAAALAGCGNGKDPSCPGGNCSIPAVAPVASQCDNVTCPANFFCANGKCLPAVPQCKPADPACIFVPHGAFEPPEHAWWWPFASPLGPDDPKN